MTETQPEAAIETCVAPGTARVGNRMAGDNHQPMKTSAGPHVLYKDCSSQIMYAGKCVSKLLDCAHIYMLAERKYVVSCATPVFVL